VDDQVARGYLEAAGVRHIVALRGDPPAGRASYTPHPGGYAQAEDLVRASGSIADFDISVGAYPETHPAAARPDADLDFSSARSTRARRARSPSTSSTPTSILRFLDRCAAAGITVPIVPGILPVSNFKQVQKFSAMCGASCPAGWPGCSTASTTMQETRRLIAAVVAAEQVRLLQANGRGRVPLLHAEPRRPDLRGARQGRLNGDHTCPSSSTRCANASCSATAAPAAGSSR
jgi:methylenetetrahydrofolate reductase (NADPH)